MEVVEGGNGKEGGRGRHRGSMLPWRTLAFAWKERKWEEEKKRAGACRCFLLLSRGSLVAMATRSQTNPALSFAPFKAGRSLDRASLLKGLKGNRGTRVDVS